MFPLFQTFQDGFLCSLLRCARVFKSSPRLKVNHSLFLFVKLLQPSNHRPHVWHMKWFVPIVRLLDVSAPRALWLHWVPGPFWIDLALDAGRQLPVACRPLSMARIDNWNQAWNRCGHLSYGVCLALLFSPHSLRALGHPKDIRHSSRWKFA